MEPAHMEVKFTSVSNNKINGPLVYKIYPNELFYSQFFNLFFRGGFNCVHWSDQNVYAQTRRPWS